jgi:hypothetical protein
MLTTCPYCEAVSDHQTPVGEGFDTPQNGDASMCGGCCEVSVFDFTVAANIRKPTDDEQDVIAAHPAVRAAALLLALRDMQ